MKLFSDKLTKAQYLLLFAFCIIEIICFLILYLSYKPFFSKVFAQSREISIEKTKSITQTLSQIFELSFHHYIQDLKLIGKHMSFLANDQINTKSQYYQNIINNTDKHIYFATTENLKKYFNKYYDDTQNKFLFFENYIKDYFENTTNQIIILEDLMNKDKHPELNSISYYKLDGDISDIENNIQKTAAAKYLISILKTIFINRFSVKGSGFEIIRYYLLTQDEIYIYPPEPYNNTLIYSLNGNLDCFEYFPLCMFYYFIEYMYYIPFGEDYYGYIYPIMPITTTEYEKIINTFCLNIPFDQIFQIDYFEDNAMICMDINMTKILVQNLFKSKDKFNFFLFTILPNELVPIYSDREEMYEQIKAIFNDTKFGMYSITENNYRLNKYYNLFQFLYLDIIKEPSLLKENDITIDNLIDEYEIILNKTFEEIFKFIEVEEIDHFVLDIQKTTCQSDLYYNGKKCLKDDFLLIVYKLNYNLNYMNEFFIEEPNKSLLHTIFFSMSIKSKTIIT